VENSVGVGDIDDTLVLGDLGDEVTGVKVVADWHTESEDQDIAIVLHDLLNMCLGLGVERTIKVGIVSLEETRATNWVAIIVGVDASSGKDSNVDALLVADICQVQGTDNIISNGLFLMVLTPIDVGSASRTSSVEDVGGLVFLDFSNNSFSVLHANGGREDLLALALEESLQVTSNPSFTTPD